MPSADGSDAELPSELEVPADAAGTRLDQFLAVPVGSRAQAQGLIEAGLVLVDGRARAKRHVLRGGERVVLRRPAAEASTEDGVGQSVEFGVVFEDEHLLVVDKPAGLVVHPARGNRTGTLAQALSGRSAGGEEPWRAGIVHRLDRDTSGLLVVAKNDAVHRALKELIASRAMRREYLTLVAGVPPARSGTIDAPIGRDRHDRVLMSIDSADPREARTHFTLERVLGQTALLRVVLDTGRTHQIRVHVASIGHPVVGDRTYGGPMWFGLERQFLHAARLAFVHPVTGESVDVRSELPADLSAALEAAQQAAGLPAGETSQDAT
ncbi:MAG: RluA family pseudouridine synthase [Solirubrobacteraceae bacterium]